MNIVKLQETVITLGLEEASMKTSIIQYAKSVRKQIVQLKA